MKKIIKTIPILFVLIAIAPNISAQKSDEQAILKVLSDQTAAWNNGDIESFMKTYWNNDSLLFIGKSGANYGYQATLDNYKKRYPDTTAMGKLHFDIIETKQLAPDCFFVVGKWHLQRTIGNLDGAFSLLLKKQRNRWLIVADHSS